MKHFRETTGLLPAHDPEQAMAWTAAAADGRPRGRVIGEPPASAAPQEIDLRIPILGKNDLLAARNRADFRTRGLVALNLVSSPGSGKTSLLERTLDEFGRDVRCGVVVGDLETERDAQRLRRSHAPVVQITTGNACHLDAEMVAGGVDALNLEGMKVLFIENVGNLVCPVSFDLGESARVILLSASEGEDKPLKYPPIFKSAQVVLITKIDVAGVLGFDCAFAAENVRLIAPQAKLIQLSSRSGKGMAEWYQFLNSLLGR